MNSLLLFSTVIYLSTYFADGAEVNSPCGGDGWIPYKDEKCVKLFTSFATRQQAENVCNGERSASDASISSLVSIRSLDEQHFLTEYVFNSSDASNRIWIGAQRRLGNSAEFAWNDGSSVQRFTYWEVNRPTSDDARSCVLLQPPMISAQISDLKWIDVTCTSGNWFICEKQQAWSIERFQHTLLSIRRDLQHEVDKLRKENADMSREIGELRRNSTAQGTTLATQGTTLASQGTTLASQGATITTQSAQLRTLQDNPVPIGFVYVQLSGQPEPRTVWPTVGWTEITSTYAGLFFRAAGGNAAAFGSTQLQDAPRLQQIERIVSSSGNNWIGIDADRWSVSISTGANIPIGSPHTALRFWERSAEVRPRNQAVRIWRRA